MGIHKTQGQLGPSALSTFSTFRVSYKALPIFYTPNLIKVAPEARNTQLQNLGLGIYTLENCKQHRNEHDH